VAVRRVLIRAESPAHATHSSATSHSCRRSDFGLTPTGVILDGLGGLHLAYDLLGGKNGPLRTVTKSVSYGVMFGSAYGLPLGVWFGLVGLLVSGAALSALKSATATFAAFIHFLKHWRLVCCAQSVSGPPDGSLKGDALVSSSKRCCATQ
jgi:hypothetical protein